MTAYETLSLVCEERLAVITLRRSDSANAINLQMAHELAAASRRCAEDDGVAAVVLTGTGRFFCAGGDLNAFAGAGDDLPQHIAEVATLLHAAISSLTRMDAPTIALVNGYAAGAGMSLACATDLAIAGQNARFTMGYTKVGLSPDGSSTHSLSRLVGQRRALELILLNRVLTADDALKWGLVNEVVSDEDLQQRGRAVAQQLAAGPRIATAAAKALLRDGWNETLETQMARETGVLRDMARTSDGHEGIGAFLAKRQPVFQS